ncbi:O-antigen ligase family protein [Pedobacter psychroterrae]|uniref:O-antigen ligase domain-containing protein n=1 Tax=Pedobacter psychroterrae TaxID=2530453 RepID=A0A4R0NLI6_9SPHI|nr:O-antigen ligase family protein [Pedobacter psychroterrae]TCD01692.1 O-antigen ligase domain-containing protein [Pedobacter psychroterrae]
MWKDFSLFNHVSQSSVFAVLLLFSLLNAFLLVNYGLVMSVALIILLVAFPIMYFVVVYPKVGIMTLLIVSYILMLIIRIGVNFPLGTLIDGLQFLLILGFFIAQKRNPDWAIYKNPITFIIILWVVYNLLQALNPVAESTLAWLYTIRSTAIVMLMYFVFMYHIKSIKFIRLILNVWIGLAFFAAAYAFKQEYFGFFKFEEDYLASDPLIMSLLFIGGQWRKFSIFSDPVAFSFNMVIGAVFSIVMLTSDISVQKKILYGFLAMFFALTMVYSGTRAAYVLIPAALLLFIVLKLNKTLLFVSAIGLFFFLILINIPTSNYNLYRFQTAFKPSDDASFNVRKVNQKKIQPYIQSHPFGGGLGATGTWGERFSPNSYLAKFPPDSGYVRVAVELGYVGLFLFCTLMFIILATGISNYYLIKDPELKNYCLAMTLIVFALHIGNYPQEALVQLPTNVYFYLFVALINITLRLDRKIQSDKLLINDN